MQADEFLAASGVKCLAVCVGNVHGKYPPEGPNIDLDRLKVSGYNEKCTSMCELCGKSE